MRIYFAKKKLILVIFLIIFSSKSLYTQEQIITRVKDRSVTYLHLKFKLEKTNFFLLTENFNPFNRDITSFSSNLKEYGQFELYIPKDKFPIEAPRCKTYIVVRMPGTLNNCESASAYIREKLSLYEEIQKIKNNDSKLDVIIELNPYVKEVEGKLILDYCNVYFRSAYGKYINYLGNLKK